MKMNTFYVDVSFTEGTLWVKFLPNIKLKTSDFISINFLITYSIKVIKTHFCLFSPASQTFIAVKTFTAVSKPWGLDWDFFANNARKSSGNIHILKIFYSDAFIARKNEIMFNFIIWMLQFKWKFKFWLVLPMVIELMLNTFSPVFLKI